MKVIPPIDIINNDNLLTSSSINVGDGDPLAWNPATNYAIGARVHLVSTKMIYEAIIAGINATSPELLPAKWVEVQRMNRWVMFDSSRPGIKSQATNTISVVITPNRRISAIALLHFVNLTQIYIKVTDSFNVTLYEDTYIPACNCEDYINFNLPINVTCILYVTLTGTGTIYLEHLVIGLAEYLGELQAGIDVDTLDFSNVSRDEFGYTDIVLRRKVDLVKLKLFATASMVPKLVSVRKALSSVVAVWSGLENMEILEYHGSTTINGIYRDFSIILDSSIHATVVLELEEI